MRILQTLMEQGGGNGNAAFYVRDGKAHARCGEGTLQVVRFELDGSEMTAQDFAAKYGTEEFEFNR
jgi:hypothetical protein